MLCCLYAIGTTINSSVRFHNFPVLLLANLGQGILFLSGVGRSADPEISAALISITLILIQFGRKNSEIFAESIRTREEIHQKNLELEDANADKSHFLAAASHDLAQPLHAMGLFIANLKNNIDNPEILKTVDNLNEANLMLTSQYDNLVKLSKLDLGKVVAHKTRVRLDRLLERLVKSVNIAATEKGLRLVLQTDPLELFTDKQRLEESIRNIVLNGIRYTEKGSVSITTRKNPNGIHVLISDTGPGIAKEEQKKIFDVFYQTHNPARTPGEGRGYGLAIVKKNAELLGLEINLKSDPGEGSTFDLFIPHTDQVVDPADKGSNPVESIKTVRAFKNLNILVVDDDPGILEALSAVIRDWKCFPLLASSTEEAQAIIDNESRIDFAIVDDMLGKNESGLELAEHLSTRIFNRPIVVTGNVLPDRQSEIEKRGFRVFHKPLSEAVLHQAIATRSESSQKTGTTGN
jgi:signal transduction histidine kinase